MDVGFIPGIYNYCDRWCEKCEQQLRCMSFVMGKKIEEKGGFNFEREGHREDESIWARLKEVFESTYEVLHELAEERGLDVEDIYASEISTGSFGVRITKGLQESKFTKNSNLRISSEFVVFTNIGPINVWSSFTK